MKSKFCLRLISVLGSSLFLMLQLAPLAKAQSGNMSDGTGPNINTGGNMSDATSVLIQQLLDGTLTEINGVIITVEIRQIMLALISGEQRGIGQLVSFLVQAGVSGNLASEFARSLRGLFINGQLNQAQLLIVGQLYQRIVSTGGVRISVLNSFGVFQVITAMLARFGVDVTIPIIVGFPVAAGNLSDATNVLPSNITTETKTETEEENTTDVGEEVSEEEPLEIGESLPESDIQPTTDETDEPIISEPVAEEASTTSTSTITESPSSTTVAQESQSVSANVTITAGNRGNGGRNRSDNAGAVTAANAIVTTSDLVGGRFEFASRSILIAIISSAQSLISELLGESEVFFAGRVISIQARQTVVTVMTSSSSTSVQTYVSSLTSGGVPANYAQALGATLEGMISVESSGEVTGVDATKLTTAIAVYNETINSLSAQALSQPSDVLSCTGYALSNLTESAANAANEQASR